MPARNQDCYIGVDFGTSGVRAVAIDASGALLAQARRSLPQPESPSTGRAQQDPELWWLACLEVLDELLLKTHLNPLALAVDGTSGTLLVCTESGTPCGPALMYNDSRSVAQAQSLARIAPADTAVHSPTSALAKLLFLMQNPDDRMRHALHQADWIVGRLSGTYGLSDENNALKMGYDPVLRCWPDWLTDCSFDSGLLPKVAPVGQPVAHLHEALLARWNLPGPVQIMAGTTDSNAATLACGIGQVGEASTALGSTLVLKVLSDQPVFDAGLGVYSHRIGKAWLVGGASNSGGGVLRSYFDTEELQRLSKHIDPDTDSGLDYYPLPATGERFPRNDPGLTPRMHPRPDDPIRFLHGLLEGIARIEAQGYRQLQALGAPYPSHVVSSGGGANNTVWQKMRARLLGVPVTRANNTEAAYGAALIAAGRIFPA